MLTRPDPKLVALTEHDPHAYQLVCIALGWGLRYYKYPVKLIEDLDEIGIDIQLVTDEVDRQIAEMPSISYH